MGGGGKGGGSSTQSFQPMIDQAIKQYEQGASAFALASATGQSNYLKIAADSLATLAPTSSISQNAIKELSGFLGVAPADPIASLSPQLKAIKDQIDAQGIKLPNDMQNALIHASNTLDSISSMTDPAKREAAKLDVQNTLKSFQDNVLKIPESTTKQVTNPEEPKYIQTGPWKSQRAINPNYVKGGATTTETVTGSSLYTDEQQRLLSGLGQQVGDLSTNIGNQVTGVPGQAPSPADIQSKLEQTPGYQFQLNQGTKALQRTAAAKGSLLSGNTLAAAQEYGQGIASNAYNAHIAQLAQLAGITMPATAQTAANQQSNANQGYLANLNLANSAQSAFNNSGAAYMGGVNATVQQNAINAQTNTAQSAQQSSIFGQAGAVAGYAFGGPVGGAIGSLLGGLF